MKSIDNIFNKVLARVSAKITGFTTGRGKKRKKPNIVSICGCEGGTASSYSDVPSAPPAGDDFFVVRTSIQFVLESCLNMSKMLGSI